MATDIKPGDRVRVNGSDLVATVSEVLAPPFVRVIYDDDPRPSVIYVAALEPAPAAPALEPEMREQVAREVFSTIWNDNPDGPYHPAFERDADLWFKVADGIIPIIARHLAERDARIEDLSLAVEMLDQVIGETAAELGCKQDNEEILIAIAALKDRSRTITANGADTGSAEHG